MAIDLGDAPPLDGSRDEADHSTRIPRRAVPFWLVFVLLLWLAHALGYLFHEYAHSFTAWAFGYMRNPLALEYGHLSVLNVALLSDVDENVDYASIFKAGRGDVVSLVAVAGVLLGNGLLYAASRALYSIAKRRTRRVLGLFAFLFCLMNVGNLWCYVPVRTFATRADMANLSAGLHVSPWWILTILGVPFFVAIGHFFARLLPDARHLLFRGDTVPEVTLTAVSTFSVFVFFGSAGLHGYGDASHWISVVSSCLLFPLALGLCWPRKGGTDRKTLLN